LESVGFYTILKKNLEEIGQGVKKTVEEFATNHESAYKSQYQH
jgi:hypothetical protein